MKGSMVTEMTTMEWVMIIEVIVLAVLAVLLVCLVARSTADLCKRKRIQECFPGKSRTEYGVWDDILRPAYVSAEFL